MRPLRLVLITRRFWPIVGEAEKTLARLAREWVAQGCQVTILTVRWNPRWPEQIVYDDVPVVRLAPVPQSGWTTVQYLRTLARWLVAHREEFDLVYVSALRHEAYAALRALKCQRPVVLRPEQAGAEGDCLWQLDARCGRRIKQRCLRAEAFVAATPALERELQAAGYPRRRIHLLSDGVPLLPLRDWDRQAVARATLGSANPLLKLAQWTPLILYAGCLEASQGLDDLLAAWESLALRWPQARLWLVGEGPYESELKQAIARRHLTGRVVLIGAFDEIDELLLAAQAVVVPRSQGRGSPTVLEAMAAGLPVVASDLSDHRYWTAGGGALLVPPGDVPALAAALGRLLEEPDLAGEVGATGRQGAQREFSLARMAQEHLQLFTSLVSPAGTAPTCGCLSPPQERP